jgi:DNA polymerase-4
VSKVATGEAKNGAGEWYVERGTEKPFLAPMPIERIPGVGEKTAHLLRSMGVAKIHTLQELRDGPDATLAGRARPGAVAQGERHR